MVNSSELRMPLSLGTDITESPEGTSFNRHSGGMASTTLALFLAAKLSQVIFPTGRYLS